MNQTRGVTLAVWGFTDFTDFSQDATAKDCRYGAVCVCVCHKQSRTTLEAKGAQSGSVNLKSDSVVEEASAVICGSASVRGPFVPGGWKHGHYSQYDAGGRNHRGHRHGLWCQRPGFAHALKASVSPSVVWEHKHTELT